MGLMTLRTEFFRIMLIGDDLRKTRRTGYIVIMANSAFFAFMRDLGFYSGRVLRVLFRRAMTDFTGDIFMIGGCFKFVDILVAVNAGFGTRVFGLFGLDVIDGIRAIMPIQTKRGRHTKVAGNSKCNNRYQKQNA